VQLDLIIGIGSENLYTPKCREHDVEGNKISSSFFPFSGPWVDWDIPYLGYFVGHNCLFSWFTFSIAASYREL